LKEETGRKPLGKSLMLNFISIEIGILIPLIVFFVIPLQLEVRGVNVTSTSLFLGIDPCQFMDSLILRTCIELQGYFGFFDGHFMNAIVVIVTMIITWMMIGLLLYDFKMVINLIVMFASMAAIMISLRALVSTGSNDFMFIFALEMVSSFKLLFGIMTFCNVALISSLSSMFLRSIAGTSLKNKEKQR